MEMTERSPKQRYFSGLSRDTWLLTFGSLFSDISTEMLYPILPIFITQVLKDSPAIVGVIEGVATAIQYIIQGFSGWFADRFRQKKAVALAGYVLTALAKPFIGVSTVWQQVLMARFTDRLGAGIRSAPRDALIAGSAAENSRGKAFGLEGIGDNLGAFFGPLIAIALLYGLHLDIRNIFYFAFIPGLLAFTLVLFVREKKSDGKKVVFKFSFRDFPKSYWWYLGVTALFGIGNSSNSFLILAARNAGIPLITTIFVYAGFNLVAALSSYPAGSLSDSVGRKSLLLLSFAISALTYWGFARNSSLMILGPLFVVYGIYSGIYRAVGKALATDNIPGDLRATAIGIFSTVVGLSGLASNLIAGQLWTRVSPSATFFMGVAFSLVALLAGYVFISEKRMQKVA
jgi:MFS family permease